MRILFSFQVSSLCSCLWCIPRYAFRSLTQHEISTQPFGNMLSLNLLIRIGYLNTDESEKALVFLKIWTLKYYLDFQIKWYNRFEKQGWNCTPAVACSSDITRPQFLTKTNIQYNKTFFSSGGKTRKKQKHFFSCQFKTFLSGLVHDQNQACNMFFIFLKNLTAFAFKVPFSKRKICCKQRSHVSFWGCLGFLWCCFICGSCLFFSNFVSFTL